MTATVSGFKDRHHTVPHANQCEINMIARVDRRRPNSLY